MLHLHTKLLKSVLLLLDILPAEANATTGHNVVGNLFFSIWTPEANATPGRNVATLYKSYIKRLNNVGMNSIRLSRCSHDRFGISLTGNNICGFDLSF